MAKGEEDKKKGADFKRESGEYERRQEMLEKVLRANLRQLEQMAENHEKAGETEKAEELRLLLAKLRRNMEKQGQEAMKKALKPQEGKE